jgi:hypothetical protein
MDSPEGETPQAERTLNKNQILDMDSPEGETLQTERAVQHKSES